VGAFNNITSDPFSLVGNGYQVRAFLWQDGAMEDKADLSGPSPQNHDAVLWKNDEITDLRVLPGDSCSNAYYVNSKGQIVGTSEDRAHCLALVGEHAFLWEDGGPMVDLNTLIPPNSSLRLTYAVAINGRGEIAGFGVPPVSYLMNMKPKATPMC